MLQHISLVVYAKFISAAAVVLLITACDVTDSSRTMTCEESFSIGMASAHSSSTTENKVRCAGQYAKWLSETPSTSYAVIGRSLKLQDQVFSLDGMAARKGVIYLSEITDVPQPAIFVTQGRYNGSLRFQTKAQADQAFNAIADAIAGK